MWVNMAGVNTALGQDVDPEAVEFQRLPIQIERQITGEFGHMGVQRLYQIFKDREAVGQIIE